MHVKGPEILNMWVGESERIVREIFAIAREKRKQGYMPFLFIDEAESILGTRRAGRYSNILSTLVPMFCSEMDGIESLQRRGDHPGVQSRRPDRPGHPAAGPHRPQDQGQPPRSRQGARGNFRDLSDRGPAARSRRAQGARQRRASHGPGAHRVAAESALRPPRREPVPGSPVAQRPQGHSVPGRPAQRRHHRQHRRPREGAGHQTQHRNAKRTKASARPTCCGRWTWSTPRTTSSRPPTSRKTG